MSIVRAAELPVDLSDPGVVTWRLVNSERGAETMTCGVSTFSPGAKIVKHTHPCEETVIILDGRAVGYVQDQRLDLVKHDTSIIPPGIPHYFANESDQPLTIAYFYPMRDAPRWPCK